ncbi:MAG: hypothetical protein PHR23_06725 [bacterium]|nr:hypothetical protein [bacterium]
MNPIEKALKLRKSIPLKSKEPYWAFQNRLIKPNRILSEIEKIIKNKSLLYEARRQYIISLCAAFEIFWRDYVKITLNKYKLTEKSLENIKNIKFTFKDIHNILGYKLTIGELIASIYTFQDPDIINQVANEVMGFDFYKILSKTKYQITIEIVKEKSIISDKTVDGKEILENIKCIKKCFLIRHEAVHDTGNRFRVTRKNIAAMHNAMHLFILIGGLCWESEVEKLSKSSNISLQRTALAS